MTVTSNVRILPRAVLGAYLRTARLPLTAAARVTGQRGNAQWPPALAYEAFEASVETTVGSLLGDQRLVDKGHIRQAKLAQLRRAVELESIAEQRETQADQTFEQRKSQADEQRTEADRRAQQREQQLQREADQREQKIQSKATKKTATARASAAQQSKVIDRQERAAKSAALSKELAAIDTAKKAADADRTVDVIEDTIEGTKAARKG